MDFPDLVYLKILGHFRITVHNTYCRKKMSSLDKERHDMQSTIDAFQEGKKTRALLLQFRFTEIVNFLFKVVVVIFYFPVDVLWRWYG